LTRAKSRTAKQRVAFVVLCAHQHIIHKPNQPSTGWWRESLHGIDREYHGGPGRQMTYSGMGGRQRVKQLSRCCNGEGSGVADPLGGAKTAPNHAPESESHLEKAVIWPCLLPPPKASTIARSGQPPSCFYLALPLSFTSTAPPLDKIRQKALEEFNLNRQLPLPRPDTPAIDAPQSPCVMLLGRKASASNLLPAWFSL
jgi:hypothetical protein